MSETCKLAEALIARPSVTPQDHGCQQILGVRLQRAGFTTQAMRFGEVDNLWATRGTGSPVLCFAGHTDVVPPGPAAQWAHDPFSPTQADGKLYGRGAADMKGSLAAMVTATEEFVARYTEHCGTLAFLITSDEEGLAVDGTARVVEWLERSAQAIDWCLIGEPSSCERCGDIVRIGRRGSLTADVIVKGIQGHVAYADNADNPIHRILPALVELLRMTWDDGNEAFPATSFQISNLHAGTGAPNVIPGRLHLQCNFRYSTETSAEELKTRFRRALDSFDIDYEVGWHHSGEPFLSQPARLTEATEKAIETTLGYKPKRSTGGGTSDGRFIARTGAEIVELGPSNATIHQANEYVPLEDLDALHKVYYRILETLLVGG